MTTMTTMTTKCLVEIEARAIEVGVRWSARHGDEPTYK